MAKITIGLGLVLIVLGLGGYFGTGSEHFTALIPALFGLPLGFLGLVALKERMRKHAMHAAALIALLGLVGSLFRIVKKLIVGEELEVSTAVTMQLVVAALCAVFVVLCARSFIKARRAGAAQRDS